MQSESLHTARWSGLFLTVLLVGASACKQADPAMPEGSLDAAVFGAGGQRPVSKAYLTSDDQYAALVDEVPGFGGMFYDETGTLTIYLKDPSRLASARPSVAAFLAKRVQGIPSRLSKVGGDVNAARTRMASYDFRELLQLYRNIIVPGMAEIPGVTMGDIDEAKNRVAIGVDNAGQIAGARAVLKQLGVPENAVDIVVFEGAQRQAVPTAKIAMASRRFAPKTLDSIVRPVVGGVKITQIYGNYSTTSTLAFNVLSVVNGTPTTDRYFVTCSHCADPRSVVIPTSMSQPVGGGFFVGTEKADPGWQTNATNPNCPTNMLCRFSDAALFKYDSPSFSAQGLVALPPIGSNTLSSTTVVSRKL